MESGTTQVEMICMKFLRTLKKEIGGVEHRDHYINKCSECPDQVSMFCIRKNTFVEKDALYEGCPLPEF